MMRVVQAVWVVAGSLLASAGGSCGCTAPKPAVMGKQLTQDEIVAAIVALPDWGRLAALQEQSVPEGWALMMTTARLMQVIDERAVISALRAFDERCLFSPSAAGSSGLVDDDSKSMLLLRTMFQLPEAVRRRDLGSVYLPTGAWIGSPLALTESDAEKEYDLNWPIQWNRGSPRIIGRWCGYLGAPFNSAREFQAFKAAYPLRRLGPIAQERE